jgi:Mlc titration factor MtfA (ptsG expression regulator)
MLRIWSRRKLRRQPFPAAWRQVLERNVPLSGLLTKNERVALEKHVTIFLNEKKFEGCGGLQVTDEMRVTVAGYACLLLLGDPGDYYPRLGTVVLYPNSFATPLRATDPLGIVTETVEERLGESWEEGTVVLAWDSIEEIVGERSGDCNVIIHEFAHQIDAQRGLTDGGSLLALRGRYRDWQELLVHEQQQQRSVRRRGRPPILDPYALTGPEEFFAVATESFFVRPVRLKSNHPELYAELQAVYGVNPADWWLKTSE